MIVNVNYASGTRVDKNIMIIIKIKKSKLE